MRRAVGVAAVVALLATTVLGSSAAGGSGPEKVASTEIFQPDVALSMRLPEMPGDVEAVEAVILAEHRVRRYAFVDHEEAFLRYQLANQANPEATVGVTADEIPAYFLLVLTNGSRPRKLANKFGRLDEVEQTDPPTSQTRVERRETARLFVCQRFDFHFEVLMRSNATPDEVDAVRTTIESTAELRLVRYINQIHSYLRFRCLNSNRPKVLHRFRPSLFPVFFDVAWSGDSRPPAILDSLRALPGVDSIVMGLQPTAAAS